MRDCARCFHGVSLVRALTTVAVAAALALYLHVLADALTSMLAIGALVTGKFMGWSRMDPVGACPGFERDGGYEHASP